ncbi:MAG TPA: YggT family protein [Egibacteraceae bacterium]|nr:YggT family protein [Egibacteraceae bacterium]
MGVLRIVCLALTIYYIILIVRIVLSWVPSLPQPVEPLARGVRAMTDPLLRPLQGLLPPVRMGMAALDLSPLILFFAIIILQSLLCR